MARKKTEDDDEENNEDGRQSGNDSDSVRPIRSDMYKEQLKKISEIDREMTRAMMARQKTEKAPTSKDSSPPRTIQPDAVFNQDGQRVSKLVKWFMEPFFEDLVAGCFVRLGIGKTKSGVQKYRLCIVRNVDASDPDRKYKLKSYETCKYLNVVWDTEANAERCRMSQVSHSPPLEEEFEEWLQEAEKNGVRVPTRQDVLEKKEEIQKAYNFAYSADTVKRMQKEMEAVRRPTNVLAENMDLFSLQSSESKDRRVEVDPLELRFPFQLNKQISKRAAADEQVG
ncbi:hypothetical protein PR202_ga22419 [Eleusine coracana subsp. coracana]|uniref:Plus3 domain-containing protein n=1 Tax=Eleusine coracana subsp. coracana TaxID=191504 RepID=A0AAV5D1M8_ELECO|nr:hypothetical protein PR202_ga22419 [Eleusine coracana subsp. coracana]